MASSTEAAQCSTDGQDGAEEREGEDPPVGISAGSPHDATEGVV